LALFLLVVLHGDSVDDSFHIATHRMPQSSGLFDRLAAASLLGRLAAAS
jgi:hypothetical protein